MFYIHVLNMFKTLCTKHNNPGLKTYIVDVVHDSSNISQYSSIILSIVYILLSTIATRQRRL